MKTFNVSAFGCLAVFLLKFTMVAGAAPGDVVVYDDSEYRGFSQNLSVGEYDWGQLHNDTISSLRVPAGMIVTLYSDTHFTGNSQSFTKDTNYVGAALNDKTSSIKVQWSATPGD